MAPMERPPATGAQLGTRWPSGREFAKAEHTIWLRYSLYPTFLSSHQGFGISAGEFGVNVRDGTRRFWTEDPSMGPEDMAEEYSDTYKDGSTALTGNLEVYPANCSCETNVH